MRMGRGAGSRKQRGLEEEEEEAFGGCGAGVARPNLVTQQLVGAEGPGDKGVAAEEAARRRAGAARRRDGRRLRRRSRS